eukprot:comp8264_c0_seq1/m.3684 comp8264_c0_seq1/g.3684  ORF comp8264_c0_seq1/g.3684 comp8264_c0_seq1/m.3684 type:complete len:424 (-) comp8264_c0_seq1:82-1353(-)
MPGAVEIERAKELAKTSPAAAITLLESVVAVPVKDKEDVDTINNTEAALYQLGELYSKQGKEGAHKLGALIKSSRPFLNYISKAKSGKLVRKLVGQYLDMDLDNPEAAVALCEDSIAWCKEEKRTFLRQALEARLIGLHLETKNYTQALRLVNELVKELKKLDDKALLVEVQLLESKAYLALRNLPKSRAALTSARTSANAIYCPPILQGALDLQSGILQAEEKDYKTAYSYFYEAFEGYDSIEHSLARNALKCMLLCKIMLSLPEDVHSIISGKLALKYSGSHIDAMRAIATAHANRSLKEFEDVLKKYKEELSDDPIIQSHLADLYSTLLEQNLCRLIEPFSRVEVAHLAKLINLSEKVVEDKLSKMILDKKFVGILDQGAGCLNVYDATEEDEAYNSSLEMMASLGKVVDSLYQKAQKLS